MASKVYSRWKSPATIVEVKSPYSYLVQLDGACYHVHANKLRKFHVRVDGLFPLQLKQACVLPLLKKPTMNPDTCSSYRPISNLCFISKLIKRVVVRRFTAHVSQFNLFPDRQSAYRPFHSTETAVISVHTSFALLTTTMYRY